MSWPRCFLRRPSSNMRADLPTPDAYPRKTFSLPRACWRSSAARRLRNSSGLGRWSVASLPGIAVHYHRRRRLDRREVTGSCFCCNFPALLDAALTLENRLHADVLVAEPVGSCADLSATILQPLKDRHARDFRLARLSVVADPLRIEAALAPQVTDLHPSAAYIVRKQLEEADLIVLNKADLLSAADASRSGRGWRRPFRRRRSSSSPRRAARVSTSGSPRRRRRAPSAGGSWRSTTTPTRKARRSSAG